MDDKQQQMLESLAQQFNTTVEYLWGILVRQAYVDATLSLVYFIFSLVFLIILYRKAKVVNNFIQALFDDDNEFAGGLIVTVLFISGLFAIITVLANPYCIITGYMNPEYWALEKVMELMK